MSSYLPYRLTGYRKPSGDWGNGSNFRPPFNVLTWKDRVVRAYVARSVWGLKVNSKHLYTMMPETCRSWSCFGGSGHVLEVLDGPVTLGIEPQPWALLCHHEIVK